MSAGVIAGRLAGAARDAALAFRLGAGVEADVAVLVLTFPDLLTTILVSGAVSALLVPRFRALLDAPDAAATLLRNAHAAALAVGALGAAAIWALAGLLVVLLAPGFDPAQRELAAPLLALAGVAIPFTAATAVTTAYLQARGRFAVAASGTLVFNVVLVAVILLAVSQGATGALGFGVIAAAVVRWLPQAAQAIRLGGARALAGPLLFRRREVPGLARAYGAALGGTSVILLLPFLARALASLGPAGDVALFAYATRIVDLPVGALATVGQVAALPQLSELVARGDRAAASRLLRQVLALTTTVTLVATVLLVTLAAPIAALLYGRGATGTSTVAAIGSLAAVGLLSLPAQGAAAVFMTAFLARRTLRFPLVAGIAGLAGFAAAALALAPSLGVSGLMAAYVGLHWMLAVAYLLRLRRDGLFAPTWRLGWRP